MVSVTDIDREWGHLQPTFSKLVAEALTRLNAAKGWSRPFMWQMFEGWRHPARQLHVLQSGTSKAAPWNSAHQYGLAADLVPLTMAGWTWDVTSEDKRMFRNVVEGIRQLRVPIDWDPLHVEAGWWPAMKAARR